MEQAGREARKKNAATNGGMQPGRLRYGGMEHGGPGGIGLFQRRFIGSREMDVAGGWGMRGGEGREEGGRGDPRGPGGPPHQNYATAPGSGRYRGTAHEDGAVR